MSVKNRLHCRHLDFGSSPTKSAKEIEDRELRRNLHFAILTKKAFSIQAQMQH